jgi:hypothetical protein
VQCPWLETTDPQLYFPEPTRELGAPVEWFYEHYKILFQICHFRGQYQCYERKSDIKKKHKKIISLHLRILLVIEKLDGHIFTFEIINLPIKPLFNISNIAASQQRIFF